MRTNGFQLILNITQNSNFQEKEISYIFALDKFVDIKKTNYIFQF